MNKTPRLIIQKYGIGLLSLFFFSFYVAGMMFPDLWWTTHGLAFLPSFWKYFFLITAGLLMFSPWIWPEGISVSHDQLQLFSDKYGKWVIGIVVLMMAVLMYQFPIANDYYGDSFKVIKHLNQRVNEIPPLTNDAFFSYSLSPWEGHTTILAIVTYIAYFSGITYGNAFLWLDVICGSLFVLLWLSFIRYYLKLAMWRLIMGLAGITAPFMLIYFGHIESYAPVFLFFLGWLTLAMAYLKTKNARFLWGLIPLLLICIKLHPVALLFAPAWLLLLLNHYAEKISWSERVLSLRGIAGWILLPIFTAGAVLYFFVFEDYKDPRHLNEMAMEFDHLFLPILSPEPPLDKYNLLSANHIFDYLSEWLLWSPVALFVMWALILLPSKMSWSNMSVKITGLTLILFASLFFMINPLLSMPIDWDLMAIPAPVLLVLVVALVGEMPEKRLAYRLWPSCLGLVLLSIPLFVVHVNSHMHTHRLESVGVRMYQSYYEWSSKVLQIALDMPTYPSREAYEERKQQLLDKLKPYAIPEKDFEYARLLINEGRYYLRQAKNYPLALAILKEAEGYFPMEKNGLLYLMEVNFLLKKYAEAFTYSQKLIQIQYPDEKKSLAMAIQCALEAGEYEEAGNIAGFYINKWGEQDNQTITRVLNGLSSGENIEELKELFAQPE